MSSAVCTQHFYDTVKGIIINFEMLSHSGLNTGNFYTHPVFRSAISATLTDG